METKKILIFSTAYYPFVGGAEVAVKEITDRIVDTQFDLITAKLDRKLPSIEKIGNINVYRVGFGFKTLDKLLLALFGHRKAIKLHKERKYNMAWSMMASQASIAAARFKILTPEVKLILTMQEGDEEEHLKRYVLNIDLLYRWLIRPWHLLVFKKADFGTSISNYLIDRMQKNGMNVPIELIPNGVDVESFELKAWSLEERQKMRREMAVSENDVVLVTTSRLVKKNGVGGVIHALTKLPENIKFLILGEGELRESLELRARSLEVSERVIFKGFVSHDNLPKYLNACDIFIRASLSEGMGNSFIEAMACKIPVIATPVGGIPDFLKGGVTGYLCEPGNPESIAKTVQKVISDPNKNEVVDNAYNMVKQKYDWDLIAKQMKEVFDKVVL